MVIPTGGIEGELSTEVSKEKEVTKIDQET